MYPLQKKNTKNNLRPFCGELFFGNCIFGQLCLRGIVVEPHHHIYLWFLKINKYFHFSWPILRLSPTVNSFRLEIILTDCFFLLCLILFVYKNVKSIRDYHIIKPIYINICNCNYNVTIMSSIFIYLCDLWLTHNHSIAQV